MATPAKTVYPHISKTPGVCGGKACIAGTRIRVMDIVVLQRQGMPPEEMREAFSSRPLTLAEVHAALTYYYDHQEEIEASFRDEDDIEARIDRDREKYLQKRSPR
jgi:uncharacterized protein (DUF433 family)